MVKILKFRALIILYLALQVQPLSTNRKPDYDLTPKIQESDTEKAERSLSPSLKRHTSATREKDSEIFKKKAKKEALKRLLDDLTKKNTALKALKTLHVASLGKPRLDESAHRSRFGFMEDQIGKEKPLPRGLMKKNESSSLLFIKSNKVPDIKSGKVTKTDTTLEQIRDLLKSINDKLPGGDVRTKTDDEMNPDIVKRSRNVNQLARSEKESPTLQVRDVPNETAETDPKKVSSDFEDEEETELEEVAAKSGRDATNRKKKLRKIGIKLNRDSKPLQVDIDGIMKPLLEGANKKSVHQHKVHTNYVLNVNKTGKKKTEVKPAAAVETTEAQHESTTVKIEEVVLSANVSKIHVDGNNISLGNIPANHKVPPNTDNFKEEDKFSKAVLDVTNEDHKQNKSSIEIQNRLASLEAIVNALNNRKPAINDLLGLLDKGLESDTPPPVYHKQKETESPSFLQKWSPLFLVGAFLLIMAKLILILYCCRKKSDKKPDKKLGQGGIVDTKHFARNSTTRGPPPMNPRQSVEFDCLRNVLENAQMPLRARAPSIQQSIQQSIRRKTADRIPSRHSDTTSSVSRESPVNRRKSTLPRVESPTNRRKSTLPRVESPTKSSQGFEPDRQRSSEVEETSPRRPSWHQTAKIESSEENPQWQKLPKKVSSGKIALMSIADEAARNISNSGLFLPRPSNSVMNKQPSFFK